MSGPRDNGQAEPRQPGGFGPFQALSTFTDVQRRGLEAASQVIEGFLAVLGAQQPPAGPGAAEGNGQEPGFAQVRATMARALDLYSDLVRRSFEGYADLVEQSLRVRGVRLHAADDGPAELTVQGAAGARAAGTVWLHNTTDRPAAAVLHLTGLTAHDGRVIAGTEASFEPATVRIAPGTSVAARLALPLDGVAPGLYRGYVLAGGLPDAALPVRLLVTDAAPGSP
ncbi:MAG: hypothetical protein K0S88_3262 [Actinomycetia bacterium]|nr:hypothetical protein [Actinomycetes bacterium]